MTGTGAPSAADPYWTLPYPYPLDEAYRVTRIPVAGPAPYNTLAVVRTVVWVSKYSVSTGETHHDHVDIATDLIVRGFTEGDRLPRASHSSTASLHMMQSSDDNSFTIAVDVVTGAFDETGTWVLTVDTAQAFSGVFAAVAAFASSWVLFSENAP
jgi:hypothetical protein